MMIPMFPLLLLITALGSIILYLRTAHDIFGVLAVGTTIVCLIWGLIIAHWSIHLLALLALLFIRKPIPLGSLVSDQK
ncbi:hypothetical protein Sta7437_2117 [Stanieria cyanosphaera PCC 7437]|uniref:Uncharacterized protein n=1 Tax=Stanieria cyanosphaera (strain ATCC 29371 / PCC 7437) TaxID=111780 RepID=K9XVH0_STAC7|nr:hypothetical protein [Stanieria cyanosphaera]AFZ35667.1 hypothetical protein Sta7437_2117 [Stanieria cyanosphaera PCC 7437]